MYLVIEFKKISNYTSLTVNNSTSSYTPTYTVVFNSFGNSPEGTTLYLVVSVLKSVGLIVLMIIGNSFLIVEMNSYYKRKQRLRNVKNAVRSDAKSISSVVMSSIFAKISKAENDQKSNRNFVKMVRNGLCFQVIDRY